MRWGDSSASGRTVTLKLPDDGDEHPFKGLDVGAKNGQMLEIDIAIVEDGELETLSTAKKPKPKLKTKLPKKTAPSSGTKKQAVLENVRTTVFKSAEPAPIKPLPAQAPAPDPAPPPPVAAATPPPPIAAPTPPPMHQEPVEEEPAPMMETTPEQSDAKPGNVDGANLDAYADQMGQAAEALAAVAERMDKDDDDQPKFPPSMFEDEETAEPGVVVVRRAFDLCKAIDKQRAGFFYFMRSRYPKAPKLPEEGGEWSRDAKSTRDRVCLHCDTPTLVDLADDTEARRRFEELENEFERHERLR